MLSDNDIKSFRYSQKDKSYNITMCNSKLKQIGRVSSYVKKVSPEILT